MAKCAHQPRRLDGRAVAEEDTAAEDRRADSLSQFVPRQRERLLGRAHTLCGRDRPVDHGVQPPRRQPRLHSGLDKADLTRRRWTSMFATIATTATVKIAVPITFTCGGAPTRAAPQTKSGNVTSAPALKYVTTKSSIESAKQSRSAARIAGAISGKVTFRNVAHSFAPRSIAASSR